MTEYNHMKYLDQIAAEDIRVITDKERTYKSSWRKSGGANAWAMVRRKIDRLCNMLQPLSASDVQNLKDFAENLDTCDQKCVGPVTEENNLAFAKFHARPGIMAELIRKAATGEDIFVALRAAPGGEDGTVLAEVRDLRRYLMLVEAGMMDDMSKPVTEQDLKDYIDRPRVILTDDGKYKTVAPVPVEDSNRHAERQEEVGPPVVPAIPTCSRGYHSRFLNGPCSNCGQPKSVHG